MAKQELIKYYVTLGSIVGTIILVTFLIIMAIPVPVSVNFECDLNGIELVNVSPHKCWDDDFSNDMCPIPKDMRCGGGGTVGISPNMIIPILGGLQ